jgi:hypothetical protein
MFALRSIRITTAERVQFGRAPDVDLKRHIYPKPTGLGQSA